MTFKTISFSSITLICTAFFTMNAMHEDKTTISYKAFMNCFISQLNNNNNQKKLIDAILMSDPLAVRLALNDGTDIHEKDVNGLNPLEYAQDQRKRYTQIIRILKQEDAKRRRSKL